MAFVSTAYITCHQNQEEGLRCAGSTVEDEAWSVWVRALPEDGAMMARGIQCSFFRLVSDRTSTYHSSAAGRHTEWSAGNKRRGRARTVGADEQHDIHASKNILLLVFSFRNLRFQPAATTRVVHAQPNKQWQWCITFLTPHPAPHKNLNNVYK